MRSYSIFHYFWHILCACYHDIFFNGMTFCESLLSWATFFIMTSSLSLLRKSSSSLILIMALTGFLVKELVLLWLLVLHKAIHYCWSFVSSASLQLILSALFFLGFSGSDVINETKWLTGQKNNNSHCEFGVSTFLVFCIKIYCGRLCE